jgi:ABC-type sulfate transport system substrate-binding protein
MDKIHTPEWKESVLKNFNTYLSGVDDMTIVDRFDIVIDYNSLVEFPFETTRTVCDMIGLEIINTEYVDNLRDYTEHKHILSSKRVDEYQEIKTHIQSMDLSRMYKIYDALLARCIGVTGTL